MEKSEKEFEVRFGVIMMLDYFITQEYVDEVITVKGDDAIECAKTIRNMEKKIPLSINFFPSYYGHNC